MTAFAVQLGVCIILLIAATLFTWYEGSGILTNSFEWNYSTPFSNMVNGDVMNANDVVVWDFFIYAAKFSPTYPIIMILSSIYLIILFGYFIFREKEKFHVFLFVCGTTFILVSMPLFNAHTYGGKAVFITILTIGILSVATAWIIRRSLEWRRA